MNKIFLSLFLLIISLFSFSQSEHITNTYEEDEIPMNGFLGATEDKLVYRKSGRNMSTSKQFYYLIDSKSGDVDKVKYSDIFDNKTIGYSRGAMVHDNWLYELVFFLGSGIPEGKTKVGVVKKSIDDLTDDSEIRYLGMLDMPGTGKKAAFPIVEMFESKDGFYVKVKETYGTQQEKPFITYLDFSCEVIWHQEFPFLTEKGVKILDETYDKEGSLTLSVYIEQVTEDGSWFKANTVARGIAIVRFDTKGDTEAFNPELKGNMRFGAHKIKYLPSEKVYVGVFYTMVDGTKHSGLNIGQVESYRWNISGEIVSYNKKLLQYSEFDTKEFEKASEHLRFKSEAIIEDENNLLALRIPSSSFNIHIH